MRVATASVFLPPTPEQAEPPFAHTPTLIHTWLVPGRAVERAAAMASLMDWEEEGPCLDDGASAPASVKGGRRGE